MYLPKWGIGAAFLSAAALVGCEQGGMNEVQDEQEEVIDAQQELSEEEAELNQAEEDAAIQDMENGSAQELNDSTLAPPPLPADEEMNAPADDPAGENPFATPPEPTTPDPTTPSETTPEPASEAADDAGAAEGAGSNEPTAEETTPEPAPEN